MAGLANESPHTKAMEDDLFLKQLLQMFSIEAQEHLAMMSELLLQLERGPPAEDAARAVETLFREAHSLKGAARSVNLGDIERVCQPLERVLSAAKRGELALTQEFFKTLYATVDGLAQILARDVGDARSEPGLPVSLSRSLLALLPAITSAGPAAERMPAATPLRDAPPPLSAASASTDPLARNAPEAAAAPVVAPVHAPSVLPTSADTVRLATSKLDSLMTQAQELQTLQFGSAHVANEAQGICDMLTEWRRGFDKRSRHARLLRRSHSAESAWNAKNARLLGQLLDAFDADELFVRSLTERLARHARSAAQERRALSSRADRLLEEMKQVSMLPFSSLLASVPKLVRDLAHDSGKDVEVQIEGASLEVDRRILEQMKAPLTHLIRNAVDHGIEAPAQRLHAGKSPRGRIVAEVSAREGNRVEIAISDDGAGIPVAKVRSRAEKMGLRSESALAGMDDAQARQLVFESGLSTSPILTDLSGHGLGLAIVREKVDAMGGTITAECPPSGVGTRFVLVLPAALSTFRGVMVHAGERPFVLPSRHIERVLRLRPEFVVTEGGRDAIPVDDEKLPLVSLVATLGLKNRPRDADAPPRHVQIVIVTNGAERVALAVDEVIGDQEVLVQPLAPPLRRVRNIAAATVQGAGRVVPLINVADLIKSATLGRDGRMPSWRSAQAASAGASLLVADDSITLRTQLREILESAGYRVTTAADGMEALAHLQAGEFDLLVTDVEMPRLDGFGLTARVRSDERLSELPVILVTALDTREDKERGVEVGANAYIVKRGFDKDRLLAAIRMLI